MQNTNDHRNARKEIMKGPASRATRLKRREIRNRDDRRIGRRSFGEWLKTKERNLREQSRDHAWLDAERERISSWPTERLLSWIRWNDPNGSHDEDDTRGTPSHGDMVEKIMNHVEENLETPEEMMRSAAGRAWNTERNALSPGLRR